MCTTRCAILKTPSRNLLPDEGGGCSNFRWKNFRPTIHNRLDVLINCRSCQNMTKVSYAATHLPYGIILYKLTIRWLYARVHLYGFYVFRVRVHTRVYLIFFFYTIRESTPKWIHRFDERTRSIILSTVYLFMTRNAIHNRRTYSSSVRAFAGFFLNLTFPARSTVLGSASIVRGWPQAHREIHSWKFSSSPLNPLLYKTRCVKNFWSAARSDCPSSGDWWTARKQRSGCKIVTIR